MPCIKYMLSKLAQLWEIVSNHSKPLGPLALTHVRLDKQTHAQEKTSSAVFLCLSVFKAKLWREACLFHKYLVLLFCLLFHRPLGMYLPGSSFKMCWNIWMILKESLHWGRVHSSDSRRSPNCYKWVDLYYWVHYWVHNVDQILFSLSVLVDLFFIAHFPLCL